MRGDLLCRLYVTDCAWDAGRTAANAQPCGGPLVFDMGLDLGSQYGDGQCGYRIWSFFRK